MENINIDFLIKATGGKYFGSEKDRGIAITSVEIDSRSITRGSLFVPIVGNRSDAHDFIPEVIKNGAVCTLSEKELPEMVTPYILVDSSVKALMDIAKSYRETLDIKIVGVTGSVGKTSTREMIASVLCTEHSVFRTSGNKNNHIGTSLMITKIKKEHEIAVLEMGISEFGEMRVLSEMVKPDICVINNIESCHLETLNDRDGVLKAKSEMFEFMSKDGQIVLNGDDDKLITLKNVNGIKPIFFGTDKSLDVVASNIVDKGLDGTAADIDFYGKKIHVNIAAPGIHMILNSLAAVCVGMIFDVEDENIKAGLENISVVEGRMNRIKVGDITILDDCYNASPTSMKAGLNILASVKNRKVAILGDMLELGENTVSFHEEVGECAADNIDLIICVGELGKSIETGAKKATTGLSKILYFKSKEELIEKIDGLIKEHDTILIKASNGMKFSEVLEHIKKLREPHEEN